MDEHLKTIITEYALKRIDKTITQEEFEKLNAVLKSDQYAARFYNELMMTLLNFQEFGNKITSPDISEQCLLDEKTLKILAQTELVAPEFVIEKPEDVIETVNKEGNERPNKFFRVYNILVSVAAVIFFTFILYVHVFPPHYSVQVASVADQVGAQWNSASEKLSVNERVLTNQPPYILDKGIVKLVYDEGVDVLIEGPAEFQIIAKDRIGLKYGKTYSVVSNNGIGFSVYTDNAKVIDLGTEFGVFADSNGDTSIHVLKGKTMLIAGGESDTVSMEIEKGSARKVSSKSQTISDIACKNELFVRKINSDNNFVWRGQNGINLADIVGGGRGFGEGRPEYGIDVFTGKVVGELASSNLEYGPQEYQPVNDLKYVDGVFIPGIKNSNNYITSDRQFSYAFPETGGFFWGYVINGAFHSGVMVPKHPLILNDTVYGNKENPAICMHPNLGVTFDLEAIRAEYPGLKLMNFRSDIGISQTVKKYVKLNENSGNINKQYNSSVEFWVIIDGEKVFQQEVTDTESDLQVNVPLGSDSRYLTLAVTEVNDTISYSWALFGNPELSFEVSGDSR